MNNPVALIFFNRPESAARVMNQVKAARPRTLYLVSDGARAARVNEDEIVRSTRSRIEGMIDWPCSVHKIYSDINLGCRNRIASALNQIFEHEESCIILEDDCLPAPDFFRFMEDMLGRYANTPHIMHIGGCNIAAPYRRIPAYHFETRHAWIWGWATWRRAWKLNDFNMTSWKSSQATLRGTFASSWEAQYWISQWEQTASSIETATTWGFPWMYTCRLHGTSILPAQNLITNIGISNNATHTGAELAHLIFANGSYSKDPSAPAPRSRSMDQLISRVYCNEPMGLISSIISKIRTTIGPRCSSVN